MSDHPVLNWDEAGKACAARWRSAQGLPPPKKLLVIDDTMKADVAYRLACEGTALLWRGDFQNARQLMVAMSRRLDRKPRKPVLSRAEGPVSGKTEEISIAAAEAFNLHRQNQGLRARVLNTILIPLAADYSIPLRRAPEVREACHEVYGVSGEDGVVSLRELSGLIGAHEWRKKGVEIAVLGERIYPHYGVYSPVRGEYLALVNSAPLPSVELAFDIGTGTGVLAALLARRGIKRVIASETDPRALVCARENLKRLGLDRQVEVVQTDLFPTGRAPLIVCNPPWIPARPSSPIEYAIYDPNSRMLRGYLDGLSAHLAPGGEGWLVLSDIAEHLGLRTREELLAWIAGAGLRVLEKRDTKPHHPKVSDATDPLHAARAAEITSLWRLSADQDVVAAEA